MELKHFRTSIKTPEKEKAIKSCILEKKSHFWPWNDIDLDIEGF